MWPTEKETKGEIKHTGKGSPWGKGRGTTSSTFTFTSETSDLSEVYPYPTSQTSKSGNMYMLVRTIVINYLSLSLLLPHILTNCSMEHLVANKVMLTPRSKAEKRSNRLG
ncbi:hypothetical protein B0H16DRAFT_1703699 [Mycena metata]|uniref:Uncharacterized protein n=1 Tax=Mycena metata TaxID=1033252 RepID=A0AAD7H1K0_9AGAR|nr:hypothetical protein B0H16DRAFT_1703699 [Mycena metata]